MAAILILAAIKKKSSILLVFIACFWSESKFATKVSQKQTLVILSCVNLIE